jgi:hypothetical protein
MKRPRQTHSTVPKVGPPKRKVPAAKRPKPTPRPSSPRPAKRPLPPRLSPPKPRRVDVASIIDDSERSLVDVIDNLLNQGVVLNAEVILALANVDLVYLRLSALLCAADRVLPHARR